MELRGARDWNNPRLLCKQPRERDLSRCRLLAFCDLAEQIDQCLIRFSRLRRKARKRVAKVRTIERRIFVHLSRAKASAQRTVRNKTDSQFLERRQQLVLRLSPPQRVLALDCCDRFHCVRATDRLRSGFRKAEVFDLTFVNQFLHRSSYLFDRHVWVNTVLIEQIDNIGPKSLERSFSDLFDVLWPAVNANWRTAVWIE